MLPLQTFFLFLVHAHNEAPLWRGTKSRPPQPFLAPYPGLDDTSLVIDATPWRIHAAKLLQWAVYEANVVAMTAVRLAGASSACWLPCSASESQCHC